MNTHHTSHACQRCTTYEGIRGAGRPPWPGVGLGLGEGRAGKLGACLEGAPGACLPGGGGAVLFALCIRGEGGLETGNKKSDDIKRSARKNGIVQSYLNNLLR